MAYLRPSHRLCDYMLCKNTARMELLDWQNMPRGHFCGVHGGKELKKRQKFEDTHNRDGTSREKNERGR